MMIVKICLLAGLLGALAACGHGRRQTPAFAGKDWLVTSLTDEGIANAVVRQGALYPYHFVEGGAALNPLGAHDLTLLAQHYRQSPGTLSLRRGESDPRLHAARQRAVLDFLAAQGVPEAAVRIVDTPPGGDGVPSERAFLLQLLAEERSLKRQAPKAEPLQFKISGNEK